MMSFPVILLIFSCIIRCVCCGSLSKLFFHSLGTGSIRFTDFVSPINTEDHRLSSSEQGLSRFVYLCFVVVVIYHPRPM